VDIFGAPKNFFIFFQRRRANVVKRLTDELCPHRRKKFASEPTNSVHAFFVAHSRDSLPVGL
jgi:hypothetical protein